DSSGLLDDRTNQIHACFLSISAASVPGRGPGKFEVSRVRSYPTDEARPPRSRASSQVTYAPVVRSTQPLAQERLALLAALAALGLGAPEQVSQLGVAVAL